MKDDKINISGNYLIKAIFIVASLLAFFYLGSSTLIPLLVAAIIATLLDKPTIKFKEWGLPGWAAITLSIIIMIIIFSLLTWLISSQISAMVADWPMIKQKATGKLSTLTEWAQQNLGIDYKNYMDNNKEELMGRVEHLITVFVSSLSNLLSQSLIIFVYIVLLLMQKKMFIGFFKKLSDNGKAMGSLLKDTKEIISAYFFGKGKIMSCLFVVYYIGFKVGDVPFALFLALFAALFSIIPYLGNIIGGGIAVILSYLYSGGTPALIVVCVIAAAQLLENYVLTPWIIGDETNLNPFITVFGIILLSVLWGTVGAIIALPIVGVLKVIFEHTKGMEPYAYLLKKDD